MFPLLFSSGARGAQVFCQESPNAAFTLFQSPFHITPGAQGIPAVPKGASGMIKITQHGSQPSMDGAAAHFTGIVRVAADPDGLVIGADDRPGPDANVACKFGVADDGGFGGHEGAGSKRRRKFAKLVDGHILWWADYSTFTFAFFTRSA